MSRIQLPPGRQFVLTWSIPDQYGGMTRALLHRSRAFVNLAGTPVDVLTFDPRPDYDVVEARLRERGHLIDGMRLLNLWDWLREHPVQPEQVTHTVQPLPRTATTLTETLTGPDSTALQVDHYRRDGSLLAIDDRRGLRRSLVLFDEQGRPARSFGSAWALYRFWLDELRAGERAVLIVDSKTVARFAATYRRKAATVIHVVHNSHLGEDGQLRQSRRAVFEQLDAFDGVVLLSERQRADVERLLGRHSNLAVIPNACDVLDHTPALDRDPRRGLVVASLDGRKRVEHALQAATALPGISLDVYGEGPSRSTLEGMAPVNATLHGYAENIGAAYEDASFLLLTSTAEGFPLVLLEAMSRGCLPIAYDVAYGPADVIRDGVNGFLVPEGDVEALADTVRRLVELPERKRTRMRRAAVRTAAEYSVPRIVQRWATELNAASRRHDATWAHRKAG